LFGLYAQSNAIGDSEIDVVIESSAVRNRNEGKDDLQGIIGKSYV
jgi:hypothetical protein